MGDLEATLEGLGVAAEALGGLAARRQAPLPFVSGNVSLYNQTGDRARSPPRRSSCAPASCATSAPLSASRCAQAGHFLVLVGEPRDELTRLRLRARACSGETGARRRRSTSTREATAPGISRCWLAEGRWVRAAHDVSRRRPGRGARGDDAGTARRTADWAPRSIWSCSRADARARSSPSGPASCSRSTSGTAARLFAGGPRAVAARLADRHGVARRRDCACAAARAGAVRLGARRAARRRGRGARAAVERGGRS